MQTVKNQFDIQGIWIWMIPRILIKPGPGPTKIKRIRNPASKLLH